MNQQRANRLVKMIEFLQTLPSKRFNFNTIIDTDKRFIKGMSQHDCGAVGCAIGWTPTVFPHMVEMRESVHGTTDVRLLSGGGFTSIAYKLFGLSSDYFTPHYPGEGSITMPNGKRITPPGDTARPKTVARYLIKVLEGHGYNYK